MHNLSSFTSSKSLVKYSDQGNLQDSRVPDKAEKLPTGFRLILDEAFVSHVWQSEKQRDTLQDLLVNGGSYIDQVHAKRSHPQQLRKDGVGAHQ